jgi:hypothetical protein
MDEALRPSTLGEILDRTILIYRTRFLVFLGIGALPAGVVLALGGAVGALLALVKMTGTGPAGLVAEGVAWAVLLGLAALIGLPLLLAVAALAGGAMNHAAARAFLGESVTIRGAYAAARKRFRRYLWLFVLQGLITWIAPLGVWMVLLVLGAAGGALMKPAGAGMAALIGVLALLSLVALAGYCVWMTLWLCLGFPACVVEQTGAWVSLKRSMRLSKGTRGRVFLLYLLGTALNYLLVLAISVPVLIGMALLPGAGRPEFAQTLNLVTMLLMYGGGFVAQAVTKPVYGIALMLFYYDQRIRQEGFDIEWMMERAGLVTPVAATGDEPVAAMLAEEAPR